MVGASVASVVSRIKVSSFAQRIASIAVLLPLTLFLVYWSVWTVTLLTVLGVVGCLVEFYSGLRHAGYRPRPMIGIVVALLFCGAALLHQQFPHQFSSIDITGIALSGSIVLALVSELPRNDQQQGLIGWALTFTGACYVGVLLSYFILLRGLDTPLVGGWLAPLHLSPGAAWVTFVLAIPWAGDGVAYLVGKSFGRHRMAPVLSPKKSWEGAVAGLLGSVLTALLAVPLLGLPIGYGMALLLGGVGNVVGQVGDLVESMIKRRLGLKDMSNIVPGHGGIFDRIDSVLLTGPVLYYLIMLLT